MNALGEPIARPAAAPVYHRITYSSSPYPEPPDAPKLFHDRDAIAFFELVARLPRLGYDAGTTIHFYPDDQRQLGPRFAAGDLLVLCTRPPMNDAEFEVAQGGEGEQRSLAERMKGLHKAIIPSNTDLELAIFAALRPYLRFLSRSRIELTDRAIERLDPRACARVNPALTPEHWRRLVFFMHGGAEIMYHACWPEKDVRHDHVPPSTLAFFIRIPAIAPFGCSVLASFGMDGNGTLIWNRAVRMRFPELLEGTEERFVIAEIRFPAARPRGRGEYHSPIPPKPLTPEFADDAKLYDVQLLTR
jgi:hypothetical protein